MIRYITYFYSHEAQLNKFQIEISLDFKLIENFLQRFPSVIAICSFFFNIPLLLGEELCIKLIYVEKYSDLKFSVLNNSLRPKMSCLKYEVT